MTKLDHLIRKLCPNGVEYKTLDKVCSVNTGTQLNKEKLLAEAEYPVINGGINPSGFWHEYNTEKNTITISQGGASAGYVNYMETPFWAGAHCFVVRLEDKNVNYRYLYHFIKSIERNLQQCQQGAGIPSVSRKTIYDNYIPVPPLEVQCEIVHILDKFTLISSKLSSELSLELKDRQKQHDYYKKKLLSFEENIPRKTLAELCKISAGGDIDKNKVFKEKSNEFNIPVYSNGIGDNALYGFTDTYKIEAPAITISGRGTIGYCELRKENFYPIVRLICVKNKTNEINISFLKYYIDTISFQVPTTGIPQLTVPMVSSYLIPIPPMKKQEKIVNILDKFDKIYDDIEKSLYIEIETIKKQYEYYRDKLLTFKELKK